MDHAFLQQQLRLERTLLHVLVYSGSWGSSEHLCMDGNIHSVCIGIDRVLPGSKH